MAGEERATHFRATAPPPLAKKNASLHPNLPSAADVLADHTNRPLPTAKTPATAARPARPSLGPVAPTPGSAFASRARRGEAVATLRPDVALPPPPPARDMAPATAITQLGPPPPTGRLLTDSLAARAAFVDSRIRSFATARAAANAPAPDAAVGAACQTTATVVGRIVVADGGDGGGRPTAGVAAVEGGVGDGGGRSKLDLSRVPAPWRLFPGQCVALTGACPAGHTLVADAVGASVPPPRARSRKSDLRAAAAATGDAGLRLLVAAGPFATGDGVSGAYEGLDAVLDAAAGRGAARGAGGDDGSLERPADALVLIGPFVDADAPGASTLDRTFDDVFEAEIVSRLAAFSEAQAAAGRAVPPIVLVPSPRDATALPSFPTPPLPLPPTTPANVVAVPNPATFSLGAGLVIGVSGHDILKDLARAEAAGGPTTSSAPPRDRLASMAGALLEQSCYYPLYPPAPGSFFDAGAAAGTGEEGEAGGVGMSVAPDVLILPSDLTPFARVATAAAPGVTMEGDPPPPPAAAAVAVNPGRAVKGGGGAGSLALLSLAPLALARGGDDADDAPHGVVDRCRVDVVRV